MVEIIEARHVPIPVAKEILEKLKESMGEEADNPIINNVYEYLARFSKCSPDAAKEAMEKLREIGFSEFAAAMLVNLVPREVEEAKALLGNIDGGYEDEKIEKAVEVLSSLCGGEEQP